MTKLSVRNSIHDQGKRVAQEETQAIVQGFHIEADCIRQCLYLLPDDTRNKENRRLKN